MIILTLFGTLAAISDNPATDSEDPEIPTGQWVTGSMGQWGYIPAAHGDDKNYAYPATGTGAWVNLYFNPSLAENQHKSFELFNMDSGNIEYYDDYEDFLGTYTDAPSSNFGVSDIFDTDAFWLIIAGILTIGTVLGVAIFGSGLSEWAQRMIFIYGGYGALWLFLSAGASDLLLESVLGVFGSLMYIGLTLTFIVGVVMETSGGE